MPSDKNKSKKQIAAEADVEGFREDRGPFVVAADNTRMPMVFTDASDTYNRITFANDSFLALTGYEREEILGNRFNFLLAPGAEAEALEQIEAAFVDWSGTCLDLRCQRKDGSPFWAGVFISPVRDQAGTLLQHFASFLDQTKQKQKEEHLRFLLDELNHRTQNTLATVQAIASQTLRGAADPAVVDAFQGRILALSKAHSLLGRENWDGVSLREVIDQVLRPFGLNDERSSRFLVEGDDIRLAPKAALTLAMVFHELATNATRHGALSNGPAGRVGLTWQVAPSPPLEDRLRLQWQESGGPATAPPCHKGFGSRLIGRGLPQELGGEIRLDFEPQGVVCQIAMPVQRAVGA